MSHTIYYGIVPAGVHVIMSAAPSTYDDLYMCKMSRPPYSQLPNEYNILVHKSNIFDNKKSAERKIFLNRLAGVAINYPRVGEK